MEGKADIVGLLKVGAPDLVKETVNSASLAAFLRKKEDELNAAHPDWWLAARTLLSRQENLALSVRKIWKKE